MKKIIGLLLLCVSLAGTITERIYLTPSANGKWQSANVVLDATMNQTLRISGNTTLTGTITANKVVALSSGSSITGTLNLTGIVGGGVGGIYQFNGSTMASALTRQDGVSPADLSISAFGGVGLGAGRTGNNPSSTTYNLYAANNGNVGIGTTAPGSKLDVNGDVNITGTITANKVVAGSGGIVLPKGSFLTDGISAQGLTVSANTFQFGGGTYLYNKNWYNQFSVMQLSNTGALYSWGILDYRRLTGIANNWYVDAGGTDKAINSGAGSQVLLQDGAIRLQVAPSVNSDASYTVNTAVYVSANGNVGIGTTAPSTKLHLFSAPSATNNVLYVDNNGVSPYAARFIGTNSVANQLIMVDSYPGKNANYVLGNGGTDKWYIRNVGDSNRLGIYPADGSTETIVISQNGNVGIGTTAPLDSLHVKSAGNSMATYEGTNTYQDITISGNKPGQTNAKWAIGTSAGDESYFKAPNAFFIYNNKLDSLALAISSSNNNVGLGINNPSTKLEVNGTTSANYYIGTGGTVTPSAIEGSIWYNRTSKKLNYYNGSAWVTW